MPTSRFDSLLSRPRWTREDAREVVAALERSGKSVSVFAADHGLDPQRLYLWRRRLGAAEIAVGTALAFRLRPPPAQIRASGTTALGSCLGFWRRSAVRGQGCRIFAGGSQRRARTCIRSQVVLLRWLRLRRAWGQLRSTSFRNTARVRPFVGTAWCASAFELYAAPGQTFPPVTACQWPPETDSVPVAHARGVAMVFLVGRVPFPRAADRFIVFNMDVSVPASLSTHGKVDPGGRIGRGCRELPLD